MARPRVKRLSGRPDDGVARQEAFRVLRTNLLVSLAELDRPLVIVTSANANEGKTAVAGQLALSLVRARRRVVLVDVDLRHADVHRIVGAHNEYGVSDVLLGERDLRDALQFVRPDEGADDGSGLYVLAAGRPVHNPTELLSSARVGNILEELARQADIVLLDSPPVLPVADTLELGRIVAGAILLVESRVTSTTDAERAKAALTRNQTRLLGIVLNKVQSRDERVGYGYGYGSRGDHDSETAETSDGP